MESVLVQECGPSRSLFSTIVNNGTQKIASCGGVVDRVATSNPSDVCVLLSDGSGPLLTCSLHSTVVAQYPMLLEPGTMLVLKNVTYIATSCVCVVCPDNIRSVFVRGESGGVAGRPGHESSPLTDTLEFADEFA